MKNDLRPTGKIVIAGGSGFIGTNLAKHLTRLGCDVIILSRQTHERSTSWRIVQWDGRTLDAWADHLDGASALVNLAGRTVDCIKTPEHCDEILRSRVESTRVLGLAVRKVRAPPRVWVQMSTAHIVGDPPALLCDEDSPPGYGLAPFVGTSWENACLDVVSPEMRLVMLRTSFVLGRNGGALKRLSKTVKWGLGGTVGRGHQGMSWIHELDMTRLFIRAIADSNMKGVYVASAPNPVSNQVFMRELRVALDRPVGLPTSEWMVRVGARWILRTDPELALCGRYCVSRRLREEQFDFAFPELGPALRDIFSTREEENPV